MAALGIRIAERQVADGTLPEEILFLMPHAAVRSTERQQAVLEVLTETQVVSVAVAEATLQVAAVAAIQVVPAATRHQAGMNGAAAVAAHSTQVPTNRIRLGIPVMVL
jgi:hypothetical protein